MAFDDILAYLTQTGITYDELFYEDENSLVDLLSDDSGDESHFTIDQIAIRDTFKSFWKGLFTRQIQDFSNSQHIKSEIEPIKIKGSKLDATEKILLISLMQNANMFPKENQLTNKTQINELISALTGISSENEVKRVFNNKVSQFHTKRLSSNQLPSKLLNLEKIKPLVYSLKHPSLISEFEKLEKGLKSL